jgi:DICT domain-containing protein
MLALSRAIEDESLASSERPHLVAAFQTRQAYDAAHARWNDLLASAASAIVFADFPRVRRRGRAREVPIRSGAPLHREWSVVNDAPGSAAVMAGWERADGRFEVVWTIEPTAVRIATEVGRRLALEHAPRLVLPEAPSLLTPVHDPAATIRRSTALTNRVIAYLD